MEASLTPLTKAPSVTPLSRLLYSLHSTYHLTVSASCIWLRILRVTLLGGKASIGFVHPYTQFLEQCLALYRYSIHGRNVQVNKRLAQLLLPFLGHHRNPLRGRREVLHQSAGEGARPRGGRRGQAEHRLGTGGYQRPGRPEGLAHVCEGTALSASRSSTGLRPQCRF